MNWITRMIQRGHTVSSADASAAVHAFNQAMEYDELANYADKPNREAHYRQKADAARRNAYALSQGLDYDDLLIIAAGEQ